MDLGFSLLGFVFISESLKKDEKIEWKLSYCGILQSFFIFLGSYTADCHSFLSDVLIWAVIFSRKLIIVIYRDFN